MPQSFKRSARALPGPVSPDPHRWGALAVLLVGAFLPPLDYFIVNLALPAIRHGLRAPDSTTQFIISAYAAAYAVLLVTGGRLGDIFGRRRMFLIGMTGFAASSAWCGLSWTAHMLLAGRICQGATAAIMAPQVLASIHVLFPSEEKGRALSLYGGAFGLAAVLGQMFGGLLIAANLFHLSWRAIFLVNLPITAVALTAALLLLKENRPSGGSAPRLDIPGAILFSLTLATLVYPLIRGREAGWPLWSFVLLAFCPVLLALFWRIEKREAARGGDPLLHPALFRAPGFSLGLAVTLLFYTLSAFFLTFSIYLQAGVQRTPLRAGLAILPFSLGYLIGPLASPRVVRWCKATAPACALAITAAGLLLLAAAVNSSPLAHTLLFDPALAIMGFGQGVVLPVLARAVIAHVEPRLAGAAAGAVHSALQVSSALGIAIVGGVFFGMLHGQTSLGAIAHAFAVALVCIAVFQLIGATLALRLPAEVPPATSLQQDSSELAELVTSD